MTTASILPFLLLYLLFITLPVSSNSTTLTDDCPTHCGNLSIPFPFGIRPGCSLDGFLLTCNETFNPPRTFLPNRTIDIEVFSLNPFNSTATIKFSVARECYTSIVPTTNVSQSYLDITGLPYVISNNSNKFIALGCDTIGYYDNYNDPVINPTGCLSLCNDLKNISNGTCSGIGCCQTAIQSGMQMLNVIAQIANFSKINPSLSPCSYAFLIDDHQYEFMVPDLTNFYSQKKTVPVVLDWAVGTDKISCKAAANTSQYLCGENTYCTNSENPQGYRCICKDGYEGKLGNPYLPKGCEDIDECEDSERNSCSDICTNTQGSYVCSCPHGYKGDGKKTGSGCCKFRLKLPLIQTIVGCGLGFLFLFLAFFIFYYFRKKRRMFHLRESFFKQNGGLLLEQQLSAQEGVADTARIFTAEELELATDNYANNRILGHGGNGTVYKGILPEKGQVVAIKKSHSVDTMQIEQFINEVVLLSQVIHKNVVRLLGCCLETQVPLLVYEYVPNGTLDHHLHRRSGSLDWVQRLRIAGEMAEALAYLHSAIARPIFHRDVKAANILLDHNYMAKMSDFGASRLIPLDRTEITTLVMGTLGYLDPEYFHTGQLTEKSDVYSFGVVLVELLTGQKPISSERQQMENLAIYFILKLREGELQEIVEERVKIEGSREQIEAIAELAKRCLELKGDERPTMREVAAEIERVGRPENDAWETAAGTDFSGEEEEEQKKELTGVTTIGTVLSSETEAVAEAGTRYFSAPATVK